MFLTISYGFIFHLCETLWLSIIYCKTFGLFIATHYQWWGNDVKNDLILWKFWLQIFQSSLTMMREWVMFMVSPYMGQVSLGDYLLF
jgi:hypothetical protein